MRTITGTIAKLIMLGLFFVFSNATLATPSYAGGNNYHNYYKQWWKQLEANYGDCKKQGWSIKCKLTTTTDANPPSSTGLFVTRCNGEVGWWNEIPFQDGSVLCVAMSTADFYHNDGNLGGASCVKSKLSKHGKLWKQETSSGVCPTHKKHYEHNDYNDE